MYKSYKFMYKSIEFMYKSIEFYMILLQSVWHLVWGSAPVFNIGLYL